MDTSAFIAFLDRSDSYHPAYRRLFVDPPALATSALTIADGHGWFLRRYDSRRAIEFLNFIDALDVLTVFPFDPSQLAAASRIVKKYQDQKLTLADAHGLALMSQLRIKECWSTDRHLGLSGVPLVS